MNFKLSKFFFSIKTSQLLHIVFVLTKLFLLSTQQVCRFTTYVVVGYLRL